MPDARHIVKFWRGTRNAYNALGRNNELDYWTRYSVIEPDGRRNEYFGAKPIVAPTGVLYPVLDVVATLPDNLNVGDRYLVGHDGTFDASGNTISSAEYYIVEIAADLSQSTISPLGNLSVKIVSEGLKTYQVVNNVLTTYDDIEAITIDGGTF